MPATSIIHIKKKFDEKFSSKFYLYSNKILMTQKNYG